MLTTPQLSAFFPDLTNPLIESALLLVHSRFSTNTFPSWPLAHPYRSSPITEKSTQSKATKTGCAREALASSELCPVLNGPFNCTPGGSDTARFDEALELLHLGGRSIEHAVLMMIPEAWENNSDMDQDRRDFYRYHAALMSHGMAECPFTDGEVIGAVSIATVFVQVATVTDDDLVVMASEVGVIDIEPEKIVTKGRLQPGRVPHRHPRRPHR